MKYILLIAFFISTLLSNEDLQSCVQTEVSKTSVIFTCMHGEYYIEYDSSSKKTVKEIKTLYTKADKYKYIKDYQEKR